ncbi:MAG TPA: hypothetical protein VFM01_19640, partial [Nakamurella sp.]|nr:hypothetical protein [Nakamurella sp.]
ARGNGSSGDGASGTGSGGGSRGPSGAAGGGPGRPALTGPEQRRRWHRRSALALAVVVLVLVALAGSTLWVRSQYYVGVAGDTVAVFRGVNGSLLGLRFSSFQENSCAGSSGCLPIKVSDLQPAARNQVLAGIQAGSLTDARSVMSRLSGELLPPCPKPEASRGPSGSPTPPPTDPTGSAPGGPGGSGSTGSTSGPGSGTTTTRPSTAAGTTTVTGTSGTAGTGARHSTSTLGEAGANQPATTAGRATGSTPAQDTTTGAADADAARGRAPVSRTPGAGQPAGSAPTPVVTIRSAPTTLTVRVTVTPGPHALFDSVVQRALLVSPGSGAEAVPGGPAVAPGGPEAAPGDPGVAPTRSPGTTTRAPTGTAATGKTSTGKPATGKTATGSTTTGTHRGSTSARPSTSTVTAETPTVTVTQTITAGPTVTGTPLAPAPAEPGVSCRITG